MRFYLKINLSGNPVKPDILDYSVFNSVLDIRKEITGDNYFFYGLRYSNPHPSLVEYYYDNPVFENDHHLILVGGTVFYRLSAAKNSNYVPSLQELLAIMTLNGDNHYQYIKGNYYILIYDKSLRSLKIYSSPFFLSPAYVSLIGENLIFSNHIDFIISQLKHPVLYPKALVEFTLFDHPVHTASFVEGVKLIPGGHKVTVNKKNELTFDSVYDIAKWHSKILKPRKESLANLNSILNSHLQYYINSTDKFNLALTGGFDGRLNLAFVKEKDYKKMNSYSYGKTGSNQISIPQRISLKLHFNFRSIKLDEDFAEKYAEIGYNSIFLTGGVTSFNRAMYPYAYSILAGYSRSCILGQCDMIRPLYKKSAGGIFNVFSKAAILHENYDLFIKEYRTLRGISFINPDYMTDDLADGIYEDLLNLYVRPYPNLSAKERYYFFLYKESIMKYWHTECHLVNLYVDDFISFSDLDFIEELHNSEYCGLYKGLFAENQFGRKRVHDLYIELTTINKNILNNFYNDRYLKPKYLKHGWLGFIIGGLGKKYARLRNKVKINDTFEGVGWTNKFYEKFNHLIKESTQIFLIENILNNHSFDDNNEYRKERHISLKIWMQKNGF